MAATGFRGLSVRAHATFAHQMRSYIDDLYGSSCTCDPEFSKFSRTHLCAEQLKSSAGGGHAIVSGTYRATVEPLLQHYGLKTRWLDVVDNIWVALWFACHAQITVGRYAHHSRRSVGQEGTAAKAYVYVFETGETDSTSIPGYQVGEKTRLVDLRYSVPSIYLRPHAQHGVLIAPRQIDSDPTNSQGSLKPRVSGVIEINLADALDWLNTGGMTSGYVLFPPATRDEGYRRLLDWPQAPPIGLGSITYYGPGN
ncbi:FRG domain-containing protein [Arthrobacter sp. ZBG10]|uniref:FRG domain-containing protein n=1 Tax=Arthrobacter sp. ZBG10 TaxID=1676590 RepID=UPI0009E3B8F8